MFASCGLVGDGNDEDAALGWGTGSKGEGMHTRSCESTVPPGRLRQRVVIACQRIG